jgi:hypothetical protein
VKVVGKAGPDALTDPPPVYDDTGLLDRALLTLFRRKVRPRESMSIDIDRLDRCRLDLLL